MAGPGVWPEKKDGPAVRVPAPRGEPFGRVSFSAPEEARRAHTCCIENRSSGPSPLASRCISRAAPFHRLPWGRIAGACLSGGGYQMLPPLERHAPAMRSEEHTSELQSHLNLVCRLLLEKKKK